MQRLESQMPRDAEEREFTIDISTEPHALELAILTLAASNILPRIPEQLPPKEAARDILGLFLNIRELFLNGPGSRQRRAFALAYAVRDALPHIAFLLTSLASEEEGLALAIRVVSFQDETTLVSRAAKQLSGKAWLFQLVTLSVRLLPQKKAGFRKKVKKKLAKR